MVKTPPHLRLFYTRCTVLAFLALVWSFLNESKPEYLRGSPDLTEDELDKHLKAVLITGAVFLVILAVLTLTGMSIESIGMHFFMICLQSVGILLIILSIIGYWDVRLLWIPAVFSCILPAICETVYLILKVAENG